MENIMLEINSKTKHIVCFSGGESSSIVGLEVAINLNKGNIMKVMKAENYNCSFKINHYKSS